MKAVKNILIAAVGLLTVVSCKKEADVTAPVEYTGPIMVSFNNYEGVDGNMSYRKAELTFKDSLQDPGVELKLTNTTSPAPADIYVYLTKVDALVTNYNTTNGGSLTTATSTDPGLQYDFSKPIIIKQGTRRVSVPLKVNPARLAASGADAIGLAIQRVEGAGAIVTTDTKQSKLIVEFGARNKYDGVYSLNIKTTGWGAYGIADGVAGNYPSEVELITTGPSSVSIFTPNFGNLQPALSSALAETGFGATTPLYTFNDATNKMTMVMNTSPDDGRGRTLSINASAPSTTNLFNPANHNIDMNYIMTQTGRPNQTIEQKLTYLRPR